MHVATEQGQRRPSERRNRDAQILEAAVKVFSEKGYSAASLQDVADSVGLLKGSLYHYISSKESLLFRILQESHRQAEALMEEMDALALPVDQRLRAYIERLTLWYLVNRERASLYFTDWRYLTGEYAEVVRGQRRRFQSYLHGIVSDAHQQGLTREDLDVKVTSLYILSAVNSVPMWYRSSGPSAPEQVAAEVAELACSTVFGRPTPRRAPATKR